MEVGNVQLGTRICGFHREDVAIQVEELRVKGPVIVAPIGDQLLLGLEGFFLVTHQAVINLPKHCLRLQSLVSVTGVRHRGTASSDEF